MALTISGGDLGDLAMPDFCPRCFWLQRRLKETPFKIPLPGIFSSIDSYVKNVVRDSFDTKGRLPSWFPQVGQVTGYEAKMHWSTFKVTDSMSGATLRGVPDEIFYLQEESYHIVDYKTARLSGTQHRMYPKYDVQLNAYAYIAARVGLAPVEALTLVYLDPDTDLKLSPQWLSRSQENLTLGFTPKVKAVAIKPDSFIEELLSRANAIYHLSAPPSPPGGCKNCSLVADLVELAS